MNSEENWVVYPCNIKGEFAMITTNIGLGPDAVFENLPWAVWVKASFEPAPGGPFEPRAGDDLMEVEDWFEERISRRGGLMVGRLTAAGRRELFAYSATDDGLALQEELDSRFGALEFEVRARHDPAWEIYRSFLYPEPIDFQRIRNQQVVRILSEHGDDASAIRWLDHVAAFADPDMRARFKGEIEGEGFEVSFEDEDEDGDYRFRLGFRGESTVELITVDRLTVDLFRRVEELGGVYDGWGCPVVSSADQ